MQYLQEIQASELEYVSYFVCLVQNQIRIKGNQPFPLSSKMSIEITEGKDESMFKYVYVCYKIKFVPRYTCNNVFLRTTEFLTFLSPLMRLVFYTRQPCRPQDALERSVRVTFTFLLLKICKKDRLPCCHT